MTSGRARRRPTQRVAETCVDWRKSSYELRGASTMKARPQPVKRRGAAGALPDGQRCRGRSKSRQRRGVRAPPRRFRATPSGPRVFLTRSRWSACAAAPLSCNRPLHRPRTAPQQRAHSKTASVVGGCVRGRATLHFGHAKRSATVNAWALYRHSRQTSTAARRNVSGVHAD